MQALLAIVIMQIHQSKSKHSELNEMGGKSFELCCYEYEPYIPLLFCAKFKLSERVFLVILPLRHFQAASTRTEGDNDKPPL